MFLPILFRIMESTTLAVVLMCLMVKCVYTQSDGCPMGCYCKHRFVDCTSLMDFPTTLALDTERIRISHMNIGEIPKLAFSYLPNVTLIEIEQCNVGIIAGCAFMNMPSIEKIVFDKTVIGNIESYAFNSLNNMKQIEFFKSRIGRLKAFAFYKLSLITTFNLVETNIQFFYSNALYDIRNVTEMVLANNNISDIVTSAFRDVRVDALQVTSNSFWNMHCGVLDGLMLSTDVFSFTSNTFYCNCSVHWMLDTTGREKYNSLLPETACHGPGKLNETATLGHVSFDELKCKRRKTDSKYNCGEVEIRILNPTCGANRGHGGLDEDSSEDGSGTASTNLLLILVGLASVAMLLF